MMLENGKIGLFGEGEDEAPFYEQCKSKIEFHNKKFKIEKSRYERLKNKIDSYKQHYENLLYLLLSLFFGFLSISLYLPSYKPEYFKQTIPIPLDILLDKFYLTGFLFVIILFGFFFICLLIIGFLTIIGHLMDSVLSEIKRIVQKIKINKFKCF